MGKVIYLTGAPATGKSSVAELLCGTDNSYKSFIYSKQLLEHVRLHNDSLTSQDDLRRLSSGVITREDVLEVDAKLLQFATVERATSHVVIDSHAVSKESYGFRVTPFDHETLAQLSPDVLVCLYADAEVIRNRIVRNPQGRPLVSPEEAIFHANAQGAVAISYSTNLGAPLYFLDSSVPLYQLVQQIRNITGPL